jgi:hypothetical protein
VAFRGQNPTGKRKLLTDGPFGQHEVLVHAPGGLLVVGLLVANNGVHQFSLHGAYGGFIRQRTAISGRLLSSGKETIAAAAGRLWCTRKVTAALGPNSDEHDCGLAIRDVATGVPSACLNLSGSPSSRTTLR